MSELETNDYIARQNQVRQAWVKEIPADFKAQFSAMEQKDRFAHYVEIDNAVMKAYRSNVAKLRETKSRLLPSDTDSAMTHAAKAVVTELLNS